VEQIGDFLGGIAEAILAVLSIVLIPDWDLLIGVMPVLLILGVLGPILTLLMVGWLHHFLTRRRGRVRITDVAPSPALLDAAGVPVVPPNVPFCTRDHLVYPPSARRCDECKEELSVRCPVDGTMRFASQQLCRGCGTRYVLGASSAVVSVRPSAGPPPGGAAVA
jgi:hypothetical protein